MEAPVEECERTPLSLLICVFLAYERFDLFGEQATDGRVAPGREHLRLPQRSTIESHGDVLLSNLPLSTP